jgi:transcriptional/translational regulatory protein YebC/TACO1
VALIVEALSDNRNRTGGAVRAVFTKHGGNLGATGAVSHMFAHVGEITYAARAGSGDAVLEAAIEVGADDVQSDASGHVIMCGFESLAAIAEWRCAARAAQCGQGPLETYGDDGGR